MNPSIKEQAERKAEEIEDEFRMIISHALLGYDLPVSREDWNLVFKECTKFAQTLINEKTKVFRKVSVSERLPQEHSVVYFAFNRKGDKVKAMLLNPDIYYHGEKRTWMVDGNYYNQDISFWLEEIIENEVRLNQSDNEARIKLLENALRELVACKNLNADSQSYMKTDDYYAYLRRFENAWEAARKLIETKE